MTRREVFSLTLAPAAFAGVPAVSELRCDVAVIGGGVGGCAAALALSRNGLRVVMTEETDWIGGQLTSQAVPPDEHPWIESFGATRSYRAYRQGVRDYYRAHYPLTAEARAAAYFNPGAGRVSRLTHEPRVSLAVLEQMLAPYVSGGALETMVGVEGTFTTVLGDPGPTVDPGPLPKRRAPAGKAGFSVSLPVVLGWEALLKLLHA